MICLDTTILIYAINGRQSPGADPTQDKAHKYIEYLARRNAEVMIPAPVIAEYFAGPAPNPEKEIAALLPRFFIAPLDHPAAVLAGELTRGMAFKAVLAEDKKKRQAIKTDAYIIAIAITHLASTIVTNDIKDFKRLANNKITVVALPDLPTPEVQLMLPTD